MLNPKIIFYGLIGIVFTILLVYGLQYIEGLRTEKDRLFMELVGQKEAYKQLSDKAAKLEVDYESQSDLMAQAQNKFADEKAALQSHIEVLSDVTFLIKEKARQENNSDVVYSGKTGTGWVLNEVRFENGPPIGYVLVMSDGRVTSKMYNHQINVNTVISKDESSGRYSIISKADYVLKAYPVNSGGTNWVNKPFPLDISGGVASIDPTEPIYTSKRFYFWDPKLNINANVDPNGMYQGLGASLMGFGGSKNDLDWKFAQLGAEIKDKTLYPTFTPIMWRPFSSFIDNTYIGPGVALTLDGMKYFLGVQVGL